MGNFIDYIHVRNFKSIRECNIEGCKRINLFIGRPNVGKSNILEALSLFSIPYLKENTSKKLSNLIRLGQEAELFYKGEFEDGTIINTSVGICRLEFDPKDALRVFIDRNGETYMARVDDKLSVRALSTGDFTSPIKRYDFKKEVSFRKGHAKYLIPPFGTNLLAIVDGDHVLKAEVSALFREYGLSILSDKSSHTIKIEFREGNEIFLVPYNSIADTLQRIIFYKAAIASNSDSVLLFEEPEAHSFPPYMTHLTQEMLYKRDNQYFLATHSPFILNDLLENAGDELAVYIVSYLDGQTQVRPLGREEMHRAYQTGVDFFTNYESFV